MKILDAIFNFFKTNKKTFVEGDQFNIIDYYYSVDEGKKGVFICFEWPSGLGDTVFIEVQTFLEFLHELIAIKYQWQRLSSGKMHPEIYAGGSKGFIPLSLYIEMYVVDGLINIILKKVLL